MNAMMSDRTKRPGHEMTYRGLPYGAHVATEEATRLLARTEPLGRDMAHGTFSRGAAAIPFAPARAALAEALAAFVAD
jgi:hypothetical protein